jgi:hypothetical protein
MQTQAETFTTSTGLKLEASNGLPSFYTEFATAKVEGIGEVRIGIRVGNLAVYVMMPGSGRDAANPPHLFIARMSDLIQPLLVAAVERFKTGAPLRAATPA